MWLPTVLGQLTRRSAILAVSKGAGRQFEHPQSPGSKAGRTIAPDGRRGVSRRQYRFHGAGVQAPARTSARSHSAARGVGEEPAMRPGLSLGLVRLRGADQTGVDSEGTAAEPSGVAGSIHTFAVRAGDSSQRREGGRLAQHPLSHVGIHPDSLPFTRAKPPRLVPDCIGDAQAPKA